MVVYQFTKIGLNEKEIRKYLNKLKVLNPDIIDEFSFTTHEIHNVPYAKNHFYLSPLCGFPKKIVSFVGVE